MSEFSLLKTLTEESKLPKEKIKVESVKIKYQEFFIDTIEEKGIKVMIPFREGENFEKVVESEDKITKSELSKILREYRGYRSKE